MSVRVDVSEVKALARRLERKASTLEAQATRAVAKTANDIEADAKTLAPVDTGALRSSISSSVRGLSAEIGPTVDYGVYQEFGTSRMSAQPFLGPAFDRRRPGFEAALAQLAERGI